MIYTFKTKLAKFTLLLCCCIFINVAYSQDQTYSLCVGDSVTLTRLSEPSGGGGPVGPYGSGGTPNCGFLSRTIEPNDETVQEYGSRFIVFPNTTTTYTVSSQYIGGPGSGCNSSSIVTDVITVMVENCTNETPECTEPLSFTQISDQIGGIEAGLYGNVVLQHYGPILGYFYELRNICPYPSLGVGSVPYSSGFYNCKGEYLCSNGGLLRCEIPVNEATETLILKTLNCETTGTEHQKCVGESVLLAATGYFSVNPSSAPDSYPQTYNCGTTQLSISPSTNVVVAENGFMVNPTVTTTYIITSNGESDTCPPQSSVHTVIVDNCEAIDEPAIFTKYPWLTTTLGYTPSSCAGISIIEYDAGSYNFIQIIDPTGSSLYFENGTFYCNDQPGYSCVDAYNLSNITDDSFGCSILLIPGCIDPNALNYNPSAMVDDGSCEYNESNNAIFSDYPWLNTLVNPNNCTNQTITLYDAGSYNFIHIQNGSNGDLYYQNGTFYCSDAPGYSCVSAYNLSTVAANWNCDNSNTTILGCTDNSATNYNPSATEDDGSCEYESTPNCTNYTGTFFFQDCGGTNYYFIQLEDGRIFDPYFADEISFTPFEGQQVNFDFVLNTEFTTPCTVSEAPITITCIEAVSGFVFDDYPWLNNEVNPNNCNGEIISVYDAGSYNFLTIQSASGTDLYYQNGTFYCSDAPGYSCVQAYNLSSVTDSWSCGDLPDEVEGCTDANANNYNPLATVNDGSCTYNSTINFNFTKYPWLNALVNPIKCSQQPKVTEYDFGHYAFIYFETSNGGSLYRNDGVFYCSDTDGQTCLNNYNLTEESSVWTCANGSFQQFDQVFVICPGEEVTLRPDYSLNFIPCTCPPCAPVGPPPLPLTTWSPSGTCSDTYCYPLTVSPASTTMYTASAESVTYGYSGCFPTGPPPPAGATTQTTFLVIVEPCNPAKTASITPTQKTAKPSFHMYPNPTTNKVFVKLPDEAIYQISLMDVSGKVMKQAESNLNANTIEINVQDLPKGMYLMALQNNDQQIIQKLIIE